tara:strand:- start:736 stop:909 length:174 start_codon:yes stop_codon:yes gene_type:complete
MTDKDFKNINQIQQILKFIDKKKLDVEMWSNANELKKSLVQLLAEHKELTDHMKFHH